MRSVLGFEKGAAFNFIIFFLALTACVPVAYGPKTEKKSVANYLSGEHFESPATVGPVVFLKRKEVMTKISGQLLLDNGIASVALKHQRLKLLQGDEKILAETMTDFNGKYEFSGEIADGRYRIQLDSDNYVASQIIEVNGYTLRDITILAGPKK